MMWAWVPRGLLATLLVAVVISLWEVDAHPTYRASLKPGKTSKGYMIKTQAVGYVGIQVFDSSTLVLTADIKRLDKFRSIEIRDARRHSNANVSYVIYTDGDGGSLDSRSGQLLVMTGLNQSFADIPFLGSRDAWLAVTTKKHKVGELVGRLELEDTMSPDLYNVSIRDIIAIVNIFNSFFEVATKMGLPAVSLLGILPTAASQMTSPSVVDALTGPEVTDEAITSRLYRDSEWASAAYDEGWIGSPDPRAYIAQVLKLPVADVIDAKTYAGDVIGIYKQPYYVAIDRTNSRIVVGIRGSVSLSDWATDFMASTRVVDAARGVGAHDGMFISARVLLESIAGPLASAVDENAGFALEFIGHSLGAGLATLSAYMVRNRLSSQASTIASLPGIQNSTTAIGYSTPPVLTKDAAMSASPYVTSVVLGNDIVPRASLVSVKHLIDTINGDAQSPRKLLESSFSPLVYDWAISSVDSSLINGALTVYPMYAPGTLYHMPTLIEVSDSENRIQCAKKLVSAPSNDERFKSAYFKFDMIDSHSLTNVVACLAQINGA